MWGKRFKTWKSDFWFKQYFIHEKLHVKTAYIQLKCQDLKTSKMLISIISWKMTSNVDTPLIQVQASPSSSPKRPIPTTPDTNIVRSAQTQMNEVVNDIFCYCVYKVKHEA